MAEMSNNAFVEALAHEDELGCVVRAHLHIEHLVDQHLELVFPNMSALRSAHLEYDARVSILEALGYKPIITRALRALGSLRNSFAHRLDFKLTPDRMDNLFKSLDPEFKAIMHETYGGWRAQQGASDLAANVRKLSPKDVFVVFVANVRGMLMADYLRQKASKAEKANDQVSTSTAE